MHHGQISLERALAPTSVFSEIRLNVERHASQARLIRETTIFTPDRRFLACQYIANT